MGFEVCKRQSLSKPTFLLLNAKKPALSKPALPTTFNGFVLVLELLQYSKIIFYGQFHGCYFCLPATVVNKLHCHEVSGKVGRIALAQRSSATFNSDF